MSSQFNSFNIGPAGVLDVRQLKENLHNGHLSLSSAIKQGNCVIDQFLQVIEEFADNKLKLAKDQGMRIDMMDKVINELSEKSQAMQQALLYKEEKYDEKCREVERYKVICELSAKAAVTESPYYVTQDKCNDASCSDQMEDVKPERKIRESSVCSMVSQSSRSKRHVKVKQDNDQIRSGSAQYIESKTYIPKPNFLDANNNYANPANGDNNTVARHESASQYAGRPTKRTFKPDVMISSDRDLPVRSKLETIGAVNIREKKFQSGPMGSVGFQQPLPVGSFTYDRNKRPRISMPDQSNEVLNSSCGGAYQMKQNISQIDYHKQVSGGIWTKMSGRRKKEWPF